MTLSPTPQASPVSSATLKNGLLGDIHFQNEYNDIMIKIKKINHVDIIIPQGKEDEARSFYCDVLGLREIEKPASLKKNGGLWLEIPETGTQVHISIQEGYDPRTTKAHIAYEVDDFDLLQAELKKLSITINPNSPVPGFIRFDIRDPFGNRIEFLKAVDH